MMSRGWAWKSVKRSEHTSLHILQIVLLEPDQTAKMQDLTFLDSLVYWRLLIVPDCFEDMRVHLRLVRTWDLEVFEQQTAFETKQVSSCQDRHSVHWYACPVLDSIYCISSCHVLQQSPPNHQKGTVLGQSSNQLAKALLGDLALRPPPCEHGAMCHIKDP